LVVSGFFRIFVIGYVKPAGGAQGEITTCAWSICDSPETARKRGVSKVQSHQWCKFEIKDVF
jgi:hypothetical protein